MTFSNIPPGVCLWRDRPALTALAALVICSALHLIAMKTNREALRRWTKALLVPLIAAAHIAICGTARPFVLAALLLGWIGDLLLIPGIRRRTLFTMGALAFLLGHGCYIAAAFAAHWPQLAFGSFSPAVFAAFAAGFALLPALAYTSLRKKLKKKERPMILVYMTGIACMAYFMVVSAAGDPVFPKLLAAAGALLFTASDCILAGSLSGVIKGRGRSLAVMLTYIPAQALIALGFALSA